MAYAAVFEIPGDWATYEKVIAELGDFKPDGLILHAAAPTANGVRMIDIWESRQARDRFGDSALAAARQRAGQPVAEALSFDDFEVEHLKLG